MFQNLRQKSSAKEGEGTTCGEKQKETSESTAKRTDTDGNPWDSRGDTALSRNSDVSAGKDSEKKPDTQIEDMCE